MTAGDATNGQTEKSRSARTRFFVPVTVSWRERSGKRVTEKAVTEEISPHGALLRLKARPPLEGEVELTPERSRKTVRARVVDVESAEGGLVRVVAELAEPHFNLWGVRLGR